MDVSDLQGVALALREVYNLIEDGHPLKRRLLADLVVTLTTLSSHATDLSYVEEAIKIMTHTAELPFGSALKARIACLDAPENLHAGIAPPSQASGLVDSEDGDPAEPGILGNHAGALQGLTSTKVCQMFSWAC